MQQKGRAKYIVQRFDIGSINYGQKDLVGTSFMWCINDYPYEFFIAGSSVDPYKELFQPLLKFNSDVELI